jgi:fluoroquinolone resistance protein
MSSFKSVTATDLDRILATTQILNNLSIQSCRWPDDPDTAGPLTLNDCELVDVTFSGADLEGTEANSCDFSRSKLRSTNLRESRFTDCRFYTGEGQECAFGLADLVAAEFKDCNLSMCDFSRSHLYRTEMIRSQAQGAVFTYVDCSHRVSPAMVLSSGVFRDSNFSYCDFTGANFKDCDLSGSRFSHSTLDDASFEGANLMDADLTSIEAHHLTLCDADLRNAKFVGLDLRNIDLTGVKIMEWQQRLLLETIGMIIFAD